jgi:hypothetical protein
MHHDDEVIIMRTWIDNGVDTRRSTNPVSDYLRIYLEQSSGAAYPDPNRRIPEMDAARAQDLWDYLGDFA